MIFAADNYAHPGIAGSTGSASRTMAHSRASSSLIEWQPFKIGKDHARDLRDDPLARLDQVPHLFLGWSMDQTTWCWVDLGIELMQVPAQAVDHPGPLRDQVLTTGQDQLDLSCLFVSENGRQIPFTGHRPRDGEGIDRVELPAGTRCCALASHQLRRHFDHGLSVGEEVAFEETGEVATVFQPPPTVLLDEGLPG